VGDARHGSVKRVASAVGAGSIAIRVVHHLLDEDMAAEPMDELRELRPA
jgi:thioredoxin reductase (NADPH)